MYKNATVSVMTYIRHGNNQALALLFLELHQPIGPHKLDCATAELPLSKLVWILMTSLHFNAETTSDKATHPRLTFAWPFHAYSTGNSYCWRPWPCWKKNKSFIIRLFQLCKCPSSIRPLIELGCHRTTRAISSNPMAPSSYNSVPHTTCICVSLALP